MTDSRRPVQIALAVVLVLSAGGFAWASYVERAKEAAVTSLGPEGSPNREAAERAANRTSTTATNPTVTSPTGTALSATSAPAVATPLLTAPPTTLREGSPAREASERARRTSTIPPTTIAATAPIPTTAQSADRPTSSTTAAPVPAATVPTAPTPPHTTETLFGFHTESTGTTVAGVALLLAAALAASLSRRRWVFVVVAAVTALFAALDVHEAIHQHNEGRASLVAAAVALVAAHGIASALGLVAARPMYEVSADTAEA